MIAILDYGLGNISAFANVYKNLNIGHKIVSSVADLNSATKIILPGVGAFDFAMTLLNESGLREKLDELVLTRKIPLLGICVGMQILARSSEEGTTAGFDWINGLVKRFDLSSLPNGMLLPHMGWNNVHASKDNKLFYGLGIEPRFYFLHSYYFQCDDKKDELALTDYGCPFASAINFENIYGVQFHPEKSHRNGIQILKNFANL
jgi:glutamine amidotransferase